MLWAHRPKDIFPHSLNSRSNILSSFQTINMYSWKKTEFLDNNYIVNTTLQIENKTPVTWSNALSYPQGLGTTQNRSTFSFLKCLKIDAALIRFRGALDIFTSSCSPLAPWEVTITRYLIMHNEWNNTCVLLHAPPWLYRVIFSSFSYFFSSSSSSSSGSPFSLPLPPPAGKFYQTSLFHQRFLKTYI